MDKYKITFETWNKVAHAYEEKFMDLDIYNNSYDLFCDQIKITDPKILEVGCGPGNITRYLLSQRPDFNVDAIDVAPEMIKLAQKNNPKANFKVMDCREIGTIDLEFDAIISGFCLPYLSIEDSEAFIKNCSSLLKSGGIFYLSTIEGDYQNSGFERGSTGDGSYVYYYEENYLTKVLKENNFNVATIKCIQYLNKGVLSKHLIFIAIKN